MNYLIIALTEDPVPERDNISGNRLRGSNLRSLCQKGVEFILGQVYAVQVLLIIDDKGHGKDEDPVFLPLLKSNSAVCICYDRNLAHRGNYSIKKARKQRSNADYMTL